MKARLEAQRDSVFSGIRGEGVTGILDEEDDFDLDNIEEVDESVLSGM